MLATCSNAKFLIETRVAKCHLSSMSLKDWHAAAKNDTMISKILRTNYVKLPMNSIHLPVKSSIVFHNTLQGQIPLLLLNHLNQKCLSLCINHWLHDDLDKFFTFLRCITRIDDHKIIVRGHRRTNKCT